MCPSLFARQPSKGKVQPSVLGKGPLTRLEKMTMGSLLLAWTVGGWGRGPFPSPIQKILSLDNYGLAGGTKKNGAPLLPTHTLVSPVVDHMEERRQTSSWKTTCIGSPPRKKRGSQSVGGRKAVKPRDGGHQESGEKKIMAWNHGKKESENSTHQKMRRRAVLLAGGYDGQEHIQVISLGEDWERAGMRKVEALATAAESRTNENIHGTAREGLRLLASPSGGKGERKREEAGKCGSYVGGVRHASAHWANGGSGGRLWGGLSPFVHCIYQALSLERKH